MCIRDRTEVAFAEHDVLERAKIPQARAAIIKDFFAALERAPDIPGQQLLQNEPPVTVIEEAIVATVERPYTAEEAGVVDGDDDAGQGQQQERNDRLPYSEPHQRDDQADDRH